MSPVGRKPSRPEMPTEGMTLYVWRARYMEELLIWAMLCDGDDFNELAARLGQDPDFEKFVGRQYELQQRIDADARGAAA